MNSLVGRFARALGASLLLLLLAGTAAVAAADIGHQDFGASGTAITGSKPESKLWYNDGSWWASMWSTTPAGFYIYELDLQDETWTRTSTALDPRLGTRADTLWDGTKLYVASQRWKADGGATGVGTNFETRLYRYSYNDATDAYTLDAGFPASIRTGIESETLVIAKDSTGMMWATWTQKQGSGNRVYTNHTVANDDTDWSAPAALPVAGATTATDDISSIIAFSVSGQERVGVLWSNQADLKDYFAWHVDGAADDTWTVETAVAASSGNPKPADDHLNLKTDDSGRVYAVAKTSNSTSSQPMEQLLVREPGGTWSDHTVARVSDSPTRAILALDESSDTLHVFETGPHNGSGSGQSGGDIYEKTSSASTVSFATGLGTPVIRDSTSAGLNNATSTKDNVDSESGIVVLAFDDDTGRYWHHHEALEPPTPPVASFTGTPTSGPAPLTVAFSNTSTGTPPLVSAWDFGDPASGANNVSTAKNPSHVYTSPGTYSVTLTVTNSAGPSTTTRSNYITVSVAPPPSSTFTAIAPVRVLDSRANLGLSGAFHANVARNFRVTNGTTIPNDAVAVTGNLTVTRQTKAGYIVLAPAAGGTTSTINFPVGDNRANGVTVALSGSGTLNAVYRAAAGATTHILFDVTGYFEQGSGGERFHSVTPVRVLDTRANLGLNGTFHANTARDFQVTNGSGGTIPTGATAVTGNITVTGQTRAGYVILAPAAGGSTSTINFPIGDNRANGVTVALSGSGKLNAVYKAVAGATTNILFDVTGYFLTGSSGAAYYPLTPVRVLDTRANVGLSGAFHAGIARHFAVAGAATVPSNAVAVTGNLTVTQQTKAGYMILAPAAGGATSTINFPVDDNRANGVTVPLSGSGTLNAVYKAKPGATTHLLFDVTGYFK
ncbi:MAG: hypothetical protein QOF11_198 [Chloroflexota bacterium]|nr:hypothetical protein [Chloroflexota bacterium]